MLRRRKKRLSRRLRNAVALSNIRRNNFHNSYNDSTTSSKKYLNLLRSSFCNFPESSKNDKFGVRREKSVPCENKNLANLSNIAMVKLFFNFAKTLN